MVGREGSCHQNSDNLKGCLSDTATYRYVQVFSFLASIIDLVIAQTPIDFSKDLLHEFVLCHWVDIAQS